jgi:hypothetical protein
MGSWSFFVDLDDVRERLRLRLWLGQHGCDVMRMGRISIGCECWMGWLIKSIKFNPIQKYPIDVILDVSIHWMVHCRIQNWIQPTNIPTYSEIPTRLARRERTYSAVPYFDIISRLKFGRAFDF